MRTIRICFISWLIAVGFATRPGCPQEVDRLLAAVNARVITRLDLTMARALNAVLDLGQNRSALSENEDLDLLIDQELIRQEMENYPVPESQVETAVKDKIDALRNSYAEIGGLPALLNRLGFDAMELTKKVRLIVLTEKFIGLRFGPFVTVAPKEVEDYFREKLLPDLKRKGFAAPPLVEVAPQIEALLKEVKKNAAAEQWLRNIKRNSRIEYFGGAAPPAEKKRP